MSIQYVGYKGGQRIYTTDGAADPHMAYGVGRFVWVRGRADADPAAVIFAAGKLVPIGAMYNGSTIIKPRERIASKINWGGTLAVTSSMAANQPDGSILFSNQNFRSDDPAGSPAVSIQTTRKVRFEGCNFFGYGGYGANAGLVTSTTPGCRVSLKNCIGFSGNSGTAGSFAGRFVALSSWAFFEMMNCESYHTLGVGLVGYAGNHTSADSLYMAFNDFYDIDGRVSSGGTGYRTGNNGGTDFIFAQVLQLAQSQGVPGELAYNRANNRAGQSRIEDMYNINASGGISTSQPLWLHHNLWRGAYSYDAAYVDGVSTTYGNNAAGPTQPGLFYSGGGGLISDGASQTAGDASQDPCYILSEDNVHLDSMNYLTGIGSGHHQTLRRETCASSGYAHNFAANVKLSRAGTPVQIQDYATGFEPGRWGNHLIRDMVCGMWWFDPQNGGAQGRKDFFIDDTLRNNDRDAQGNLIHPTWVMAGTYSATNNINLPVQTRAQVDQYAIDWAAARAGEGRVIGAV